MRHGTQHNRSCSPRSPPVQICRSLSGPSVPQGRLKTIVLCNLRGSSQRRPLVYQTQWFDLRLHSDSFLYPLQNNISVTT